MVQRFNIAYYNLEINLLHCLLLVVDSNKRLSAYNYKEGFRMTFGKWLRKFYNLDLDDDFYLLADDKKIELVKEWWTK